MELGIVKAVRLAGSQTALGKLIGVSPQAVQKWVEHGYAPARRCIAIEKKLAGAVTRYELNEEAFGQLETHSGTPASLAEESNEEMRRDVDLGYRQPADPKKVCL